MKLKSEIEPTNGRMRAEGVLDDQIRRKEVELNSLQILRRVIQWDKLSEEDEEKLWSYFVSGDKR